ncbi:MAG TPA: CsgG/HfaB family protein [Gemmatimonadales bacterium]|nr:CsgG/HfaB family protein [Gemmatimonadales bacterium]
MNRRLSRMLCVVVVCACARTPRAGSVTPPTPRDRFRLAAELAAAGRCDTAVVVATAAQALAPGDVRGPLVLGACQEQAGRFDDAIATYNAFAAEHPRARGVATLRAKAQLALRSAAEHTARQALAREAELANEPPQAATVAVLPLVIAGDSSVQPLARGLADLITTDLAHIRTLRLVERLQIGMLLDELKAGQSERTDPATAARVGRLLRAERMVQGTATIPPVPPTGAATIELSATVVTSAGVVRPVGQVTGPFRQLLALEKQVVFDLAGQLGIALTEAERQQILRQGPKSLAAFLAYSRALDDLDRGDYGAAARHFGAAARADPTFQAARQGQETAAATPAVQQSGAGGIVTLVEGSEGPAAAAGGLLTTTTLDVVPATGDVIAQAGGPTTGTPTIDRHLTPEALGLPSIVSVSSGIVIIFRRP